MFVVGDSGKMPFEDRVVEYLATHPEGGSVDECAQSIGISDGAVHAVLANLEMKGMVQYPEVENG